MKYLKYYSIVLMMGFIGCSDYLDEQVFTEYDPDAFLNTEAGINAVLTATYSASSPNYRETWFSFAGWTTDLQIERGGGYAAPAATFAEFQWSASNNFFRNNWRSIYVAIRNANSLLDNIDNVTSISPEKVKALKAEAIFLRAFNYYILYDFFGGVPIITSTADLDFEPVRASDEEMKSFIESELLTAAAGLPTNAGISGKATKGAALALLGRFYLNTKQWQKSADALQDVINLSKYELFPDVEGLFSIQNEGNSELIFVFEKLNTGPGWNYTPHAYPVGFNSGGQVNYGAQFQLWRTFVNSFDPSDRRATEYDPPNGKYGWIIKSYTNTGGSFIDLMNDPIIAGIEKLYPRPVKFTPDPNALGSLHGNDIPILRYAEVLVSRAEALNEIQGPNQTSIDLLNEVRNRAEVAEYQLSDFASKEALRDQILVERGWEFFTEGLRRQDLIRHGTFISSAQSRGKTLAMPHHVLFPIPQQERDANPALTQNPNYAE
jgi:hypothetical protein